ncbi:hypothetical protein BN381_390013 [Candidatus Microthrix parvicella RN1]|uniref:Uncharacterized protein n=1 Tax=Candidatus Neomicrothrix parvicella RN1 TaxID=1229780 RepID=R4Z510_9ACTN|nr:hypothetical protein BN381_390013 [Candidatus Microthrix parvicella RN1]
MITTSADPAQFTLGLDVLGRIEGARTALMTSASKSADFGGRFLDGGVDVVGADPELLGDVLLGLQLGLVEGGLEGAGTDDHQGGFAGVDELTEFLDIGSGKATPEVTADPADGATDNGRADDRGREKNADHGPCCGATPTAVARGHLVLVDVNLAGRVLGDHGGVVGADHVFRVEVLDDRVIVSGRRFISVRADEEKHSVCLGHVTSPCWEPLMPQGLQSLRGASLSPRTLDSHHPYRMKSGRQRRGNVGPMMETDVNEGRA